MMKPEPSDWAGRERGIGCCGICSKKSRNMSPSGPGGRFGIGGGPERPDGFPLVTVLILTTAGALSFASLAKSGYCAWAGDASNIVAANATARSAAARRVVTNAFIDQLLFRFGIMRKVTAKPRAKAKGPKKRPDR